jgi:hypothetical protein
MEQSVPKRRNIELKRRGITQKKEYNREKYVEKTVDKNWQTLYAQKSY